MLLRLFSTWTRLVLRALGARRRRRRFGEVDLVWWEAGSPAGEPWILLHGLGSTAMTWSPVIRALRRSCRLLVPELSALGGTSGAGPGLTVRQGARVVEQLIEAAGGAPQTLCGISFGGWMTVRLAEARPELLARAVLIDCAGYLHQDWDRIRDLVAVETLADVDRLYGALFVHPPLVLRFSRRGFLDAYSSPAVRYILDTQDEADAFDDATLAGIELPVGLVWGAHDGLFDPAVGRAMAAALPRATLEVLPDCAHAVHWERPDALVAAIGRFRERFPLPSRSAPTGNSPEP